MLVKNYLTFFRLNIKHYKPFFLSIVVFFVTNSVKAIEYPNSKSPTDQNSLAKIDNTNGISLKALELAKEPWKQSSFENSLSVLQDKQESIHSRQLILEKLKSNTWRMKMNERKKLLRNFIAVAKDANESPEFSAQATRVMSSISLMMYEKGEITLDEATSERTFLMEVAADKRRDLLLRSSAIKAIEVLKITEAEPVLESLLSDANNYDIPEIARSASVSLTRLSGTQVFPYIHKVMKQTTNARVFETAAYCLGQMKTSEAMIALVENCGRFVDGGACDFALVDMEDVILDILKQPDSNAVIPAIHATKYLWKNGQKEKYISLLYELIIKAPNQVKKEAVERLLSVAEGMPYKEEKNMLSKMLSEIKNIPEMKNSSEKIQKRLEAKLLTSQVSLTITPANRGQVAVLAVSDYGNAIAQEYGDAVYRYLDAWGLGLLANYNHAGLFAGIDGADSFRVFHAASYIDCVQDADFASEFKNNPPYYGAYTHSELTLDFAERKAIIKTARNLSDASIYYTLWNAIDPLTNERPITVSNIDNIRCDGVVEYCYEAEGYWVWEPANDRGKWNILYDPEAHNDMPDLFSLNPNIELSPWAQRGAPPNTGPWYFGGANPNNAYLISADIDLPTYEVQSWLSSGHMIVQIKAKDIKSGIHLIVYKRPGEQQWSYSRNVQHPDSDTFTQQYDVYQEGWFQYFAQDNGGNYPEYGKSVYVQFTSPPDTTCKFGNVDGLKNVKRTLKDCSGNDVTFSLTGGGYGEIDPCDCNFGRIELFETTDKSVLTISTKSKTGSSVGSIICQGPLKSINAKTIDLSGSIEIGSTTIPNPKAAVTMAFDRVSDLTINSQMSIKTLSVTEWLGGSIYVPSVSGITTKGDKKRKIPGDLDVNVEVGNGIGTVKVAGELLGEWDCNTVKSITALDTNNFNLKLTQTPDTAGKILALGSLTVKGHFYGSNIRSAGNIGKVTAGIMTDSICFAGVAEGITGLPAAEAASFSETATIKSITIKGIKKEPSYINSNIAAANILSASIAYPQINNNGVPFGLSADNIKKLTIKKANGNTISLKVLGKPMDSQTIEGDFEIRLY